MAVQRRLAAILSADVVGYSRLKRLCRYMTRPPVTEKCLSLTSGGNVRYQLKTPCRDGTTHVLFEPLDFIAWLAALVAAQLDGSHGGCVLIGRGSASSEIVHLHLSSRPAPKV